MEYGLFAVLQQKNEQMPLRSVHALVKVVDCVSSVTVTQQYVNSSPHPVDIVYKFPIYAQAAINQFEAVIHPVSGPPRVIKGVVKEREEARQEYQQAIQQGQRAALLEEQKPDIFQVVHSIPLSTLRLGHNCVGIGQLGQGRDD